MRIGIDLGGTKIAAVALKEDGTQLADFHALVPRSYAGTRDLLLKAVSDLEATANQTADAVGLSMPGAITAAGEVLRAVNLPWMVQQPLKTDLAGHLDRPVGVANDANCFALSEAYDGAAAGADVVFGVILGTGVGGGLVVNGHALAGANAIAGEWGHNPLPWRKRGDGPTARCGCGRKGCIESWLNGGALARDHAHLSGDNLDAPAVVKRAAAGGAYAQHAMERYHDRLARALASIVNLIDPDVIVLGGGLSGISSLYDKVPPLMNNYTQVAAPATRLVQARHGPTSGMRGAARIVPTSLATE